MADLNNIKIASLEDFKKQSEQIVTLVDEDSFGCMYELSVRVKNKSLISLVQQGIIPNSLLTTVQRLQNPNRKKNQSQEIKLTEKEFDDYTNALQTVAKSIMIEPTYDEVKDYLTDNHLSQLFAFVGGGAKALESFRNEQARVRRDCIGKDVQGKTE